MEELEVPNGSNPGREMLGGQTEPQARRDHSPPAAAAAAPPAAAPASLGREGLTPYTLHPTPYTLHPTPYTLHPTPCTLHPTPWGGVHPLIA